MFETEIKNSEGNIVYFKYDKEEYDIEYIKDQNMIIVRQLPDYHILEIFSDKIGFIVQSNIGDQTNFLVTDYSQKDENGKTTIQFKHYTGKKYKRSLDLVKVLNCSEFELSSCRITDNTYLVEQNDQGSCIYNISQKSKRFDSVYHDDDINKFLQENILLVSETRTALFRPDIKDTITYGINPETFQIETPIWSDLQQRLIPIYMQKEIDKLKEKWFLDHNSYEGQSLEEITIHFEIDQYLNQLDNQIERSQTVYEDVVDSKVNEEFVKKFIKINRQ